MNRLLLPCLVGMLLLSACGKAQPGNALAYQGSTGRCSDGFINEFNRVQGAAFYIYERAQIDEASPLVETFAATYHDVFCSADSMASGGVWIDVNVQVTAWRDNLKKMSETLKD